MGQGKTTKTFDAGLRVGIPDQLPVATMEGLDDAADVLKEYVGQHLFALCPVDIVVRVDCQDIFYVQSFRNEN